MVNEPVDKISGRPVSQLVYKPWVMHEEIRPYDDKHVKVQQYHTQDVYVIENGNERFTYSKRENVGESFIRLTPEARVAAVERYEYGQAQQSVDLYKQAAAETDPNKKIILAREAELAA